MRKLGLIIVVLLIASVGGVMYYRSTSAASDPAPGSSAPGQGGGAARAGGAGGAAGRGFARPPMTVELASVNRADVASTLTVVGNLIGAATVEAVPKVAGRLGAVYVRLGDRVSRGQAVAKIEDSEIVAQVKQAEAAFNVADATVRQREADLKYANVNRERSQSLLDRQLLSRSAMDDADSRAQSANAQIDLARAQYDQAKARVDELHLNLANTVIPSPVDGFIARRSLDPGAWVATNSSFISVVDIGIVRLIGNVAEKDLQHVMVGTSARVGVDAYGDEVFTGRVTRAAPVLDPTTRTAQIEVEIPNRDYRLKPGMYAHVDFTTALHPKALGVPTSALVNIQGHWGVFLPGDGNTAKFQGVTTGIAQGERTEITEGLQEGARVITTGAGALQDGDRIVLAGQGQAPGGPAQAGRSGRGGGQGRGTGRQTSGTN